MSWCSGFLSLWNRTRKRGRGAFSQSRNWSAAVGLVLAVCAASVAAMGQTEARGQNLATRLRTTTSRIARTRREHWFRHGRTIQGESAAALLQRAYRQKLKMRTLHTFPAAANIVSQASASASWLSLGPAPLASDASGSGEQDYNWVSGRATAVAVDPNDVTGNTVYVGGAYGGLWKSVNAGPMCPDPSTVTWNVPAAQNPQGCLGKANSSAASLLDDQLTLSVGAIAIQPQLTNLDSTKSVVLVGTGETNSSIDSYYGLGILRSSDAGNTWTLVGQDTSGTHPFAGIGFSQIAFSAGSPSLAVAAAAGTSQGELDGLQNPLTTNLGLYFSTDAGQSWTYASIVDGSSTVVPSSAPAVSYNAAAQQFFAALRFHGFYTSSDAIHWTRLVNQPGNGLTAIACPASPSLQTCPIYRGQITVVPNRAGANGLGEMYAWYVDANDADQGIWKTTDGGITWAAINEAGITNCGDVLGGCGAENGSYNLTLAAVPDNPDPNATTGTDLFAGAVNLYKCVSIATVSDCSGAAPNTFLNLTHVYGCPPDFGSIAKVHPSQHAMDFMQINGGGQVVMYFANDGGIYRTLDGYTRLISGDCATPNQFDSLNQTLGSLTTFISLAQHPTDQNTILGGTQGNGSPATSASQINSGWISVNSADGGFSEINPSDPTEWFTANTGVTIQRCALGIDCHSSDFNNGLVVSSSTLGGDEGPLYTPYIFDPQNPAEMIVGTCRVWRGTTQGANFSALSLNFDTQSDAGCSGSETNMVRSLSAGGPVDANGFSGTIYAGTDGTGPLATVPGGGHVWAMTTASDGSTNWEDVTGAINPSHFPVSAIAVDSSDPSGKTAYVTIMGFHVSHVWQTKNGGAAWTDFSGSSPSSLPDAPANAVLVDNATVYVGTDAGVFSSSTANPAGSWTEVGPAPVANGSQTGYLPDVPVTAMRMFNNGATKLLRTATYGRGVWQFPLVTTPDFEISFAELTQTIFAGQTATFAGTLDAFDSFNSPVTLGCTGTNLPSTCSVNPNPTTPTASSTAFSVNASGTVGDYAFNLLGSGAGLSRSASLTLLVVDFTLGAPLPTAVTVAAGATSSSVTVPLNFLGSFPPTEVISLACSGAPGLSCNFFPSGSVSSSSGATATITLTVAALATVQSGNYNVNISASSPDFGSKTVSQPLSVTVSSSEDFSLVLNVPSSPVAVKQTVSVPGTLTGLNGYGNAVQLTCVSGSTAPPSTCILNPGAMNAVPGGAGFTLSAKSNAAGSYLFGVQGVGSDASSTTHIVPVTLTFFDLTVAAVANTQSVSAGQPAVYQLNFTPEGPSTFPQSVTYSCATPLPALTSCSFTPSQIASGTGATQITLTISTVAAVATLRAPEFPGRGSLIFVSLFPLAGVLVSLAGARAKRRTTIVAVAAGVGVIFLLMILQSACGAGLTGGGGNGNPAQPGTAAGTYTVMINASEGTGAQALQPPAVPLTLTVQ